jgi:hypothetical protein
MNISIKTSLVLHFSFTLISAASSSGVAIPSGRVVSPRSTRNDETMLPFGLLNAGFESMRYQQVFDGSDFTKFYPQGVLIQSIEFGPAFEGFSSQQPNFLVNLSITQMDPDGLSTVFADNIGINETVVFGPSSISWPNKTLDSAGFIFSIPLNTPYAYDPALGNLLMEIRNFEPEVLDLPSNVFQEVGAVNTIGDTTSRLYANSVDATIGIADTLGLLTSFTVEPIPEPSSTCLWPLALVCGFMAMVRRNR